MRSQVSAGTGPKGASLGSWRDSLALQRHWWLHERSDRRRRARHPWRPTAEIVASYLDLARNPGSRVLDIGCADGHRRRHFRRQRYVGIDPLLPLPGAAAGLVGGIGEALPFADGRFEVVLLVECLDHGRDPGLCLAEALRVLGPGGQLWVFSRHGAVPLGPAAGRFSVAESEVHLHEVGAELVVACAGHRFLHPRVLRDGGYFVFHGQEAT